MNLKDYLKLGGSAPVTSLAAKVGVSHAHISAIANGKKQPSIKLALKIEDATNGIVSRSELREDHASIWAGRSK